MTKPVKVGLRAGGKPPDEFLWSVHYLTAARDAAMEFLNETQYAHVVDAFMSLAREADPRRPITEWVEPVEHYFELKDKGGPLGRINLRVFSPYFLNTEQSSCSTPSRKRQTAKPRNEPRFL